MKPNGKNHRNDEGRGHQRPPSGQNFPVIPPGIAQAEQQPDARQTSERDQGETCPEDHSFRRKGLRAQLRKGAFRGQHGHACRERAGGHRSSFTQQDCQGQGAAADRAGYGDQNCKAHE